MVFKFYGAKQRIASHYPEPVHRTIIEPFAGAAGYAVHHRSNADRVILVEKDARVAELWRRVLALSVDELLAIPLPAAGDRSSDLLVAFAAGRTTRDTPATFTVTTRMAERFDPMRRRIAAVLDECRHFEVLQGDYRDSPNIEATWFVDPPYQDIGVGRPDRTRGGRYVHSNRDIDYAALGTWVRGRSGQVIACDQEGSDWLPWNGSVTAQDAASRNYREVFWVSEGE